MKARPDTFFERGTMEQGGVDIVVCKVIFNEGLHEICRGEIKGNIFLGRGSFPLNDDKGLRVSRRVEDQAY